MSRRTRIAVAVLLPIAAGLLFWVHEHQFLSGSTADDLERYVRDLRIARFVRGVAGMLVTCLLGLCLLFWLELRAVRRELEALQRRMRTGGSTHETQQ